MHFIHKLYKIFNFVHSNHSYKSALYFFQWFKRDCLQHAQYFLHWQLDNPPSRFHMDTPLLLNVNSFPQLHRLISLKYSIRSLSYIRFSLLHVDNFFTLHLRLLTPTLRLNVSSCSQFYNFIIMITPRESRDSHTAEIWEKS